MPPVTEEAAAGGPAAADALTALGVPWAALERAVAAQLGSRTVHRVAARITPLQGGFGSASGGVFRLTGSAYLPAEGARDTAEGARDRPWSLVLKLVCRTDPAGRRLVGVDEPASLSYWRREPLAYGSGFLADLPPGLAAARCFGVDEVSEQASAVWLEDLSGATGGRWGEWATTRYGLAAFHVGQFNGAYLTGARPVPSRPWLCGDFERGRVQRFAWAVAALEDPAFWDGPLLRRVLDGPTRARVRRLVAERERRLACLDRLPRVLAHHDAARRNLFAVRPAGGARGGGAGGAGGDDVTVAVDWAQVGPGAVGADAADLFTGALFLWEVDAGQARALSDTVFEGYLAGLQHAGWRGDPAVARLGFAAAAAMRACYPTFFVMATREHQRSRVADIYGRPADDVAAQWATALRYLVVLEEEARSLLPRLGVRGGDHPAGQAGHSAPPS